MLQTFPPGCALGLRVRYLLSEALSVFSFSIIFSYFLLWSLGKVFPGPDIYKNRSSIYKKLMRGRLASERPPCPVKYHDLKDLQP